MTSNKLTVNTSIMTNIYTECDLFKLFVVEQLIYLLVIIVTIRRITQACIMRFFNSYIYRVIDNLFATNRNKWNISSICNLFIAAKMAAHTPIQILKHVFGLTCFGSLTFAGICVYKGDEKFYGNFLMPFLQ